MARAPRIDEEGLIHHVTGRAHPFAPAFPDPVSRIRFLELLGGVSARMRWEIGAFSVLTTHYHLLICTPLATLSDGMRLLQGDYARWLNRHRGTSGPVWRDRFHSRSIVSGSHLLRAAVCIDRNAAEAGLVSDPEEWPWHSFPANAGLADPAPWHSPALVHRAMGDDAPEIVRLYCSLVRAGLAREPLT